MRPRMLPLIAWLAVGCQSHAPAPAAVMGKLLFDGLGCDGCPAAFERQLGSTEGVLTHEIDLGKGQALVTYDPQKTDIGTVAESLVNKGFHVRLEPWVPIDAAFEGCANGFCGSRKPNATVTSQPGAAPGHSVYCPVSGVLLRVKDSTLKVDMSGRPVYVCCEGCSRYFHANRAKVLALRKLTSAVS